MSATSTSPAGAPQSPAPAISPLGARQATSVFQFIRAGVEEAKRGVDQQALIIERIHEIIRSYPPKVSSSWIGGDEQAFSEDVQRRLLPALETLRQAIADTSAKIGAAAVKADSADEWSYFEIAQLRELFAKI